METRTNLKIDTIKMYIVSRLMQILCLILQFLSSARILAHQSLELNSIS